LYHLFTPVAIGGLELPNHLVRSATAEFLADSEGRPEEALKTLYSDLVDGGVGLIITGHMYVHPGGQCHDRMVGIYADELIPGLRELAKTVHTKGGRAVVQINHGGMQCSTETVADAVAPSAIQADWLKRSARTMSNSEIEEVIRAFALAARRAKVAGFDGVQIHAAHGYLVNQFLSPLVNRREDEWGGDIHGRASFLRSICSAVRSEVGSGYPMLIKLGLADSVDGGLSLAEGLEVVSELESMGLDAVEISAGIGGRRSAAILPGIRKEGDEAYFRSWAREAKRRTRLPILLVGGLRSLSVMEDVLTSGDADLISMCRPLICEPDLPRRLVSGAQERSSCISGNRCWPEGEEAAISCKCPR
jgi:2,4-dienoyl-CoA reductase-like NADH-dependent reductase (Old Yellow Enzyme family)